MDRSRPVEGRWACRVKWGLRGILLIVVSTFGVLACLGDSHWKEGLARQEALEAKLRAASGGLREPFVGPAEPGDAGPEYPAILAELRERMSWEENSVLDAELDDSGYARRSPEKAQELRARFEPLLDRLRAAARRESCRIPDDAFHVRGWPAYYDIAGLFRAVTLLALSARGADVEAGFRSLATALMVALDASRELGSPWSAWGAPPAVDELKRLLIDPGLSRDSLAAAERMLVRLETEWVSAGEDRDRFYAMVYSTFREERSGQGWSSRVGGGWLFEWVRASHARVEAALRKGEAQPWPQAQATYDELWKSVRRSWNPVSTDAMVGFTDRNRRTLCARWRLLRAAARVRLGKGPDVPGWPVDPFTFEPLTYAMEEGFMRIRITRVDGRGGFEEIRVAVP